MTAETDLLPCPFCGDVEHLFVEHLEGTTIHPAYRVLCDHCGASTRYTDRNCRAAWNTRANVAHATAAKDAEIVALRAEHREAMECKAIDIRERDEAIRGWANRARNAETRAERLAEALRLAREYVVSELAAERDNFAGYEHCSNIASIEADLAKIDAALDQETTNG